MQFRETRGEDIQAGQCNNVALGQCPASSFEAVATLASLASITSRVRVGCLML
ncbi:MAG TPA: hypothetical protein VIH59_21375 [Candidatus Tectomicrobia bacterium]|jgi:hypothetical protein